MTPALAHDRSLRLFQFLREFTQLKGKPQRTSDGYTLLWLRDLPDEPEIDNAVRQEGHASAPDTWLPVRKPKLIAAPRLRLTCIFTPTAPHLGHQRFAGCADGRLLTARL